MVIECVPGEEVPDPRPPSGPEGPTSTGENRDLAVPIGEAAAKIAREYHLQDLVGLTQAFLDRLQGRSLGELRDLKSELVAHLHPQLLLLARSGFGLIVQDGVCPGAVTNAFTRANGASRYLLGGLTVVNADARLLFDLPAQPGVAFHSIDNGKRMEFFTGRFGKIRDLPGSTILGVNGSIDEGRFTVYISDREGDNAIGRFYAHPLKEADGTSQWRGGQVVAAIGALHFLEGWIQRRLDHQQIITTSPDELLAAMVEGGPLDEQRANIRRLKSVNDRFWRHLRREIQESQHGGFVFGESFTGGAINSLFQSLPRMARFVDYAVVWYHDRFKEAFGVDRSYLNPQRIASMTTVEEAAVGLLHNPPTTGAPGGVLVAPASRHTAVATSGWASYPVPGKPDNFSICVRSSNHGHGVMYTAKLEVASSLDLPLGFIRKETTKQLGVAMSQLLIARALGDIDPRTRERLEPQMTRLERFIEERAGAEPFIRRSAW